MLIKLASSVHPFLSGVDCVSKTDIDQHLTLGMQLLARGQYSDALSHFHAAIGKYSKSPKFQSVWNPYFRMSGFQTLFASFDHFQGMYFCLFSYKTVCAKCLKTEHLPGVWNWDKSSFQTFTLHTYINWH